MTPTPAQLEARHRRPDPGADQHLVNWYLAGLGRAGSRRLLSASMYLAT
jgi:hypothetical protein